MRRTKSLHCWWVPLRLSGNCTSSDLHSRHYSLRCTLLEKIVLIFESTLQFLKVKSLAQQLPHIVVARLNVIRNIDLLLLFYFISDNAMPSGELAEEPLILVKEVAFFLRFTIFFPFYKRKARHWLRIIQGVLLCHLAFEGGYAFFSEGISWANIVKRRFHLGRWRDCSIIVEIFWLGNLTALIRRLDGLRVTTGVSILRENSWSIKAEIECWHIIFVVIFWRIFFQNIIDLYVHFLSEAFWEVLL